jgi:hypothetical protein
MGKTTYYTLESFVNSDGLRVLRQNGYVVGQQLPNGQLRMDGDTESWAPEALWDEYCQTVGDWWLDMLRTDLPAFELRLLQAEMADEAEEFYFFCFGYAPARGYFEAMFEF